MSALLVALLLSAIICGGFLWRRPDARAAAGGAWQAGKTQAVQEFRSGYQYAQTRLLASNPRRRNPRRWISWGLAGAYGTAQTVAAANRVRKRAWDGARDRHAEWKAAQIIDAEVIGETVEPNDPPLPSWTYCPKCGALVKATIPADEEDIWTTCKCGFRIRFFRQPLDDPPDEPTTPDPTPSTNPGNPPAGPETNPEEPIVQTEAAGLTSYAAAHTELADELRTRMSGSENLAASMSNVLAEHSDLIGQAAVLQDHLNQAAAIAQQIAARSLAVANN